MIAICVLAFVFIGFEVANLAMVNRVNNNYSPPSMAGALFSCILLVVNYYFIRYIGKRYCQPLIRLYGGSSKKIKSIVQQYHVVEQLNFLLIYLAPAVFINATILRVWRFTSIINLIYLVNLILCLRKIKLDRKISLATFGYVCLIALWFNKESVWESLFNNPIFD